MSRGGIDEAARRTVDSMGNIGSRPEHGPLQSTQQGRECDALCLRICVCCGCFLLVCFVLCLCLALARPLLNCGGCSSVRRCIAPPPE